MGAFADFQGAVFKALNGQDTLTAIVGARIFDDVPHGSEASSPSFPFVTIGDQTGVEDGTADSNASNLSIALHAWSRSPGRLQCLQMLDAIRAALHDKSHFVSTGVLVYLLYQSHETLKDGDGETYHGVIRFGGLYQYG